MNNKEIRLGLAAIVLVVGCEKVKPSVQETPIVVPTPITRNAQLPEGAFPVGSRGGICGSPEPILDADLQICIPPSK